MWGGADGTLGSPDARFSSHSSRAIALVGSGAAGGCEVVVPSATVVLSAAAVAIPGAAGPEVVIHAMTAPRERRPNAMKLAVLILIVPTP